ncbi:hypothetical protein OROHE_004703 [Orobanche hederae]
MELQEYSQKPRRSTSHTLGELLQRVGDSTSADHQLVEVRPPSPIPLLLSVRNLTYNTKVLLKEISGEVRDDEIMAVLGASGAGKSILIDTLANRIMRESLKGGDVALNSEALESKLLKVISAYVRQDDLLFPMLTETLMFSVEFRLPCAMSRAQKRARVQALIDHLGLCSAAATIISNEGHHSISGGERHGISIGTDIIHDPILLFLDEPTSGLYSMSAFMVVNVLQRIAQSGSITVFTGSLATLPLFFSDYGTPILVNEDKTEIALDHIRELKATEGGTQNLARFNKAWQRKTTTRASNPNLQKLSLKDAISSSISMGKLVSGANSTIDSTSSVPKYANPFWKEMIVIAHRLMTNSRRSSKLFGARFGAVIITGFILATIFWGLDESPKRVQERLGFYAFAMSTTFYTCTEAIPVFLLQHYIFMRETAHNAYRRSSYVVSHAILSTSSLIILSLAFTAATYWSVGLTGGFLFYLTFVLASFWAGNSLTFLSGVIFNLMMAYTTVVAILAYFVLFRGFFITSHCILAYWIWFHYALLVKYPYQGVMQNEFEDPTKCFVRGMQVFDNSPLGAVP